MIDSVEVLSYEDGGFARVKVTLRPEKWLSVVVTGRVLVSTYKDDPCPSVMVWQPDAPQVFITRDRACRAAELEIDSLLYRGDLPPPQERVEAVET